MAQGDYPNRPITLNIGWATGGNIDIGLRMLAELASKILGQPVVVQNKTGGGSFLAFVTTLSTKPDGYTIGDLSSSKYELSAGSEAVPRKVEDATIIGCYWSIVHGLAVRADAPWHTLKELVEYVRVHPGEITYAVNGFGSPPHIGMVMLSKKEKINWKVVPYNGIAEIIPAILGGHVNLMPCMAGVALEQVKAGKMKLLAALGSSRLPEFPDIPTLMDLGYGFSVAYDVGLVGPKGIPPLVLQKLEDAFAKSAKDPKFQKFLKENNLPFTYMNGKQYTQYLKQTFEERLPIIKELGLLYKK